MKLTDLTIKDLITPDAKLTFLVGAGCSVDHPSCLPAGRTMMDALIEYTCNESEVEKIKNLELLRFEALVEIVRDNLDEKLKLIDYYGLSDNPNLQHFFLAEMMKKGHFVITTNFDFLIEYALLKSGVSKEKIIPVITKDEFEKFSDPGDLYERGKIPIYKIHGSTKNIITEEETRDSLVATIQAFGSNKGGLNVFQLEPFKQTLFNNISKGRSLVVMGYSGSDDFDIIPTLITLKDLKEIIWINHTQKDKKNIKIFSINTTDPPVDNFNKIHQILSKIKQAHEQIKVYCVDVNTNILIQKLLKLKPNLNGKGFILSPKTYLEQSIKGSTTLINLQIPVDIYYSLEKYDDALRCAKNVLEIANSLIDDLAKAKVSNKLGEIYLKLSNEREALYWFDKAIKSLFSEENIYKIESSLLSDYSGLSIDNSNDPELLATILNNMGEVSSLSSVLAARRRYLKALRISDKLGLLSKKISILYNIGILELSQKKYSDALIYYQNAFKIAENLGNLNEIAECSAYISNIYRIQKDYDNAFKYILMSFRIKKSLGDLSRIINLSSEGLTRLPEYIYKLEMLNELDLNNNELTVLPESIGKPKSLQKLNLENNKLTILPKSIGNLLSLRELNLSANQLTVLPESIGKLKSLQKLNLENNKLTTLPESIGNLLSLREINLSANQLTVLPESIGNLKMLQTLNLENNQLEFLPKTIENLISLQKLNLKANYKLAYMFDPLQIEILLKRINNLVVIDIGEPIIVYREKISKKSKAYHTKSTNAYNRILLYIEPLNKKTEKILESGKIDQYMDEKERAKFLREEADWDTKEARGIVDVYNGNILVNGASGLQRFDRIKNDLVSAFRDWLNACIIAKEPAMGIKVVFTDLVIDEDPKHTNYAQTASMVFSGLSLAMLDADPHLYEPIQRIDVKTPQGTESEVISVINKHRGQVNNVISEDEYVRVQGQLPAAELIVITDEIRGITKSKAFFNYEFFGFEKVPASIEEKLILEIRKRGKMPEELPNIKSWERFIYKKT